MGFLERDGIQEKGGALRQRLEQRCGNGGNGEARRGEAQSLDRCCCSHRLD